jgi:putative toxin-antitoxin system antitoxin component (TIGR02293 family)
MSTTQTSWLKHIGAWLGHIPKSEFDLAVYADKGLPTDVTNTMTKHGLTQGEVSSLVIPARTLKHRRSRHERLSKDETDKAIRSARILSQAQLVFGDDSLALEWMREAKRRFDGRTPMQMMETEAGGRLVEEMLFQLEHGMFA